jgi:hypothetical protein
LLEFPSAHDVPNLVITMGRTVPEGLLPGFSRWLVQLRLRPVLVVQSDLLNETRHPSKVGVFTDL